MSGGENVRQQDQTPPFAVCGIVRIAGRVLLVRHTYGVAKGRILLPGGIVKAGEMPMAAAEREIYEETGVRAETGPLFSLQCKPEQWCAVFLMEYLSGTPASDNYENSEVLLLPAGEAVTRPDLTNMSRVLLETLLRGGYPTLRQGSYCAPFCRPEEYGLFGAGE